MRLKRLELHGFKSFADKTAFDFQGGVTAFVGPNGCGKSNIVDAVRWILGEQSAKAVRGTQMADVIFNGTATRRSLGYAEASLTFENDQGRLPTDYHEVCITRRLYRSGESEYFLNRQPCRLRDIRQLFMDTGVGVQTYSIIEQGKVDRFIQANSKERRMLFEEAAGISRYKAQRQEAQGRLERAHQNLEKIDIKLDEQRRQLRSIRAHAARARKYREHSARLRDLVVSLAVKRYREWGDQRKQLEESLAVLRARGEALAAESAALESERVAIEGDITRVETANLQRREALHRTDSQLHAAETAIHHNTQRIEEYGQETERCTRAVWSLHEKVKQVQEESAAAEKDLAMIRSAIEQQTAAIAAETAKASDVGRECDRLAAAIEEWKTHTIRVIEQASALRNELNHMDRNQREQIAQRSRRAGQYAEKMEEAARIEESVAQLAGRRDELSGRLADHAALRREKESELAALEERADALETRLRDARQREAQLLSRRDVLMDIEMRSEDVENGVKRLLREREGAAAGMHILGMVADLLRADLKYAACIEAALGDSAQYIVLNGRDDACAAVQLLRADRSGRAGLAPLDSLVADEGDSAHLADAPGVLGRAMDFVRYRPELEPLARYLLGNTWVVRDMETALGLAANGGASARFVTLAGDRVDPSGAIVGGEPLPCVGLVSRKSELDAIAADLKGLEDRIQRAENERGHVLEHVNALREETQSLRDEIEQGNLQKLSNENEILNLRRRQKTLADEAALIQDELAEIDETLRGYEERRQAIDRELAETGRRHDELQGEIHAAQGRLAEERAVAARLREEVTRLKVELADREARRGGLEQQMRAAQAAVEEISAEIAATRARIEDIQRKQVEAESAIARAREDITRLRAEREAIEAEIAQLAREIETLQERRAAIAGKVRTLRAEQDDLRQQLQAEQLQEQELRVRMEELAERVFSEQEVRIEEYLDKPFPIAAAPAAEPAPTTEPAPAEASSEASAEAPSDPAAEAPAAPPVEAASAEAAPVAQLVIDWEAVENEITELRDRIRRLGRVDESTIDEEDALDIAIKETETQREDLVNAEAQLREVIRKLNRVSRDKFTATFEEVRKNFQETFRRLFGGGRCDLVLEAEEQDVLEAGIEVYACPPGKDLRSITLLSGGEKTMTTIALLFAIFRSKPSPFCILDEVDAALDESNIGRFTQMLLEFIQDSQFIIITHSKRTLGIAEVMYGITMEEKGVSKRVAVSLEGTAVQNN